MYVLLFSLATSPNISLQTKQRLYDWRRNFFKYARVLVLTEIQDRFAPKLRNKKEIRALLAASRDEIALYVKENLAKGRWIYEHPAEDPKVC